MNYDYDGSNVGHNDSYYNDYDYAGVKQESQQRKSVWFANDPLVTRVFFVDHPEATASRRSVPAAAVVECPNRLIWIACYREQMLAMLENDGPFVDASMKDDSFWQFLRRRYDGMVQQREMHAFNSPWGWCSRKEMARVWCPISATFKDLLDIWNEPVQQPLHPLQQQPLVQPQQMQEGQEIGVNTLKRQRT